MGRVGHEDLLSTARVRAPGERRSHNQLETYGCSVGSALSRGQVAPFALEFILAWPGAVQLTAMAKPRPALPVILDSLESFHGRQEAGWPTEPYEFLIWWHCGYPASDANCAKGWAALTKLGGITPTELLESGTGRLGRALKAGGMVPELRALRLLEIAARVKDEFGGDLRAGLTGPISAARKALKKFPNIADPGADRILLFGELSPVAAVPSNCPHVPVRILYARERENYGVTYREA